MKSKPHVLIVDDEPNVRRVLGTLLEQAGYATTPADSGKVALDLVRAKDPDLVLTDLKMPEMDGLELLRQLRAGFPEIPVVMLTAHGTVENAVGAMKEGAYDFLTKPFDKDHVVEIVGKALGQGERSRQEFQGPLSEKAPCGIVGSNPAIESLRRMIERVAPSPTSVLITGETGTGKELVAEALHAFSTRDQAPLVRINCGALPENLVEAELFGHERGAFTGADRAKPGRFELADGGTLFLDEIGELPPAMQVKLLRVLEDGRVDRVGGTEPRRVDVRLVAATNRDLDDEVRAGRFREDLLYRLRVVEVRVPPLRERIDDVAVLVEFFLDKQARRLNRPRPTVSEAALAALQARPWPGNVRELENCVERAVLLAEGDELGPADFGLEGEPGAVPLEGGIKDVAKAAAAEAERRMIRAALELTEGNVTRAAERLGLSRRGLQLKLKELGFRTE
ncbi:MAG: sigma-54 dependent transcriptional regulator [Acidobacteriota bacterium]|nr:sigma-54 dependent transcriptional regulator [Acidobacteriota bacterium]